MSEQSLDGRYVLRDVVGVGGMAIVYKARDMQLNRDVAIKILRPEFSRNTEFIRQFTNEALAAEKMHHPNIVDIYGLGHEGSTHYIAMEFVNGATLKEMIRQDGAMPIRRAVQMAIKILAAVNHAHRNNIIHRDIKPQNIIVNENYSIKVTDFGIARMTHDSPDPSSDNGMGSVHYFSPEQAAGQVADEKSDLYSVGVVLYEMLTGKLPFDGQNASEVAIKHVKETPVIASSINPQVTKALDEVLQKALAKDSAERYQSAADMAADLKRALYIPNGGFVFKKERNNSNIAVLLKRHIKAFSISALCIAIAVVFAYYVLTNFLSMPKSISVPSVLQMNIEDAVTLLEERGILYSIEETEGGDYRSGTVISQEPASGEKLSADQRLILYVSIGESLNYVPIVTGSMLQKSIDRLEECGFYDYSIEYVLSDEEAYQVIEQSPEGGTYAKHEETITLYVSGLSAKVPNCIGLTIEEATEDLEAYGFAVGKVTEVVCDGAPDTILSQSIASEENALVGTVVDFQVCRLAEECARTANVEITIYVHKDDGALNITLEDEDNIRTVYSDQPDSGTLTLCLCMQSRTSGPHIMRVYLGENCVYEKAIFFH